MGSIVVGSPKGSKDPNNRILEPKYYNIIGIGTLKSYYLGPWILRGRLHDSYPPFWPDEKISHSKDTVEKGGLAPLTIIQVP